MNLPDFEIQYFRNWEGRRWTWCGHRIVKYPMDMVVYQEIIWKNRPDILIETGTCRGGSALFFASVFDAIGKGKVISVDNRPKAQPPHPRITYITGRSTSVEVIDQLRSIVDGQTCMVSLDSDHHRVQVKRELAHYSRFVTPGQYLVVEDTIMDKYPMLRPGFGPGPGAALAWFLGRTNEFVVDKETPFSLSLNPGGYLRRVNGA